MTQSKFRFGVTLAVAGIGMALTGGPLPQLCAGVIGNLAGDMVGSLYEGGVEAVETHFLSEEGLLNHDIAAALGRAMQKCLQPETLVSDFQADGDYLRLQRHRPEKAAEGLATVQSLAADLQAALADPQAALNNALSEAELQDLALLKRHSLPQALHTFIEPYTVGHETYVKAFLQRRLDLSRLADCFMEELKQDGPAQWKMQTLFQHSLLTALANLQGNDTRLLELAQQAADKSKDLDSILDKADDLDSVLAAIRADLAQLQVRASDVGQMKMALETVLAQPLAELQAELQRIMTAEATQTRDHVTVEHEATRQLSEQQHQEIKQELEKLRQEMIAASQQRALRHAQWLSGLPPEAARRFFDRVYELEQLRQVVQQSEIRVVMITGRGGMGKTALAARLLALLKEAETNPQSPLHFKGVVCLGGRGLRPDLGQLYLQVQQLFEGQVLQDFWRSQADLSAKVTFLLTQLQQGRYLVLWDNLEDGLTAEGLPQDEGLRLFLQRCVETAHGVQVLVTSREPLRFRLGSQRVKELPLREGLPPTEAVRFLQTWEGGALANVAPTMLAALAEKGHGIPRALELVGALLSYDETLTPEELLQDKRLWQQEVVVELLQEGYRRLADPLAQQALRALAILGQPVPLVALQMMLDAPPELRAGLAEWVKWAFVRFDTTTKRYSLHPLDAEYLLSQMTAAERHALHGRAADYYAQTRLPESQWHSKEDVAPQLAEFEQRLALGQYDQAARVVGQIDESLSLWGEYRLWRHLRLQLVGQIADPKLNGINLGNLGVAYRNLGQVDQAIGYYEQALLIAREIGDRPNEGTWLGNLGEAYSDLGQEDKAIGYYEQALTIAHEIGDRRGEGTWLSNLGSAYKNLGQLDKAIGYYEQALTIAREIGDRQVAGSIICNLGHLCMALGEMDKAIMCYKQTLLISREIGDRRGEGNDLGNLGNVYINLGQVDKAIGYYEQALTIAREIGDRQDEGTGLGNLGNTYKNLGQVDKAIGYYEQALTIAHEIGDRRGEGVWLGNLGIAYKNLGQVDKAIGYYEQALTIAREIGDRRNEGYHLHNLGLAYRDLARLDKAITYYEQSLTLAREIGDRRSMSYYLGILGVAYDDFMQVNKSITYHEEALTIAREIGDRYGEAIHAWNLGLLYKESDPTRAVALMSVLVAYEEEVGHPAAVGHAAQVAGVRARVG